ncbi:unnamed protein product [Peronospora destructor]|uniref:Reverse transcriptase Ty1/copia-type domain-containing protein n=1 Tax=Peronospora destructor TaxID=86335 RepID=A0AAV0TN09_9STRA|nr:unnamed protein product [Peronospora destructor]
MCLYMKKADASVTIVGVYVDDVLATGTSIDVADQFFESMVSLEIKDLGGVNKFFGLRIMLDDQVGYVLDQEVTIDLLLKDHGLGLANGFRTPLGDDCNEVDAQGSDLLVATTKDGQASVKAF